MANKQKSDRVTIANLIAIVGLGLLLVFSYLGHSFKSGGEMGWDIITSVGITAFTAFLLWFMIKAKGAENQLEKWRIVEYSTLAVYVVFAISSSLLGGLMHFFVVNDNKEIIKSYAQADIKKINDLIHEYKEFETEAITNTGSGLEGASRENQERGESLREFMEENSIEPHSISSAKNFETIQRNSLVGSNFDAYANSVMYQEQEFLSVVNGWSVIQMPMKVKMVEELAKSVEQELSKLSNSAKLPKIIAEDDWQWEISEPNQCREFRIDGGVENFQFKQALQNTSGFSVTALVVVLIIHLMIILNYIAARRTEVLRGGRRESDGGTVLKLND